MSQGRRILHVEDVPSIRLVTRLALERIGGFEVLSCESGAQALLHAADFAPDLILLDAMLPQMDGTQLLRHLAERLDLREIPVVFLTGNTDPARRAELLAVGACEVLVKPFDPRQLAGRLEAILQQARAPSYPAL